MGAPTPRMHGRTHVPGGPDPIPGGAGGGIQFDTDPQEGGWLQIEAVGPGTIDVPGTGVTAIHIHDKNNGGGVFVESSAGGGIMLRSGTALTAGPGGGGVQIVANDGGIAIVGKTPNGSIYIQSDQNIHLDAIGDLMIEHLPTADPSVTNAVWADSGVLVLSGHTVPTGGGGGIDFGTNTGTSLAVSTTAGGVTFGLPDVTGGEFTIISTSPTTTLMQVFELGKFVFNIGSGQSLRIYDSSTAEVMTVFDGGYFAVQLGAGNDFEVLDSAGDAIFRVSEDGSVHIKTSTTIAADL